MYRLYIPEFSRNHQLYSYELYIASILEELNHDANTCMSQTTNIESYPSMKLIFQLKQKGGKFCSDDQFEILVLDRPLLVLILLATLFLCWEYLSMPIGIIPELTKYQRFFHYKLSSVKMLIENVSVRLETKNKEKNLS